MILLVAHHVCVLVDEGPCLQGPGKPSKSGLRTCPKPSPSLRSWEPPYPSQLQAHRAGHVIGWGPVQHSLSSLGFLRRTSEARVPRPQPPGSRLPNAPTSTPARGEHRSSRGLPAGCPSSPRRPWPLTGGSHRRLHRHRSLPDSARPRALQSMSHRPRPGLRLGTARAGAAVQAWLRLALRAAASGGLRVRAALLPSEVWRRARARGGASSERSAQPGLPPPPPSWACPPGLPRPPPCPPSPSSVAGRWSSGPPGSFLEGDPSTCLQSWTFTSPHLRAV